MKNKMTCLKQGLAALGTAAIALTLWINPASADPFRTTNPRAVGAKTETAFKALFQDGNYVQAAELLKTAEDNEPLAFAMKAALSFVNQDIAAMGQNATLTRTTAEKLVKTDPLRGHLYMAAGHFLEGAYTLSTQGTVQSTPAVLGQLQKVFDNLKEAEKISPNDPELNLIKGYMDLMLAVNLPFSNPDQAITRLQSASPTYLAQRGIAIGYRDLGRAQEGIDAIAPVIQQNPNNPELYYLNAQLLRLKSDKLQGAEQRKVQLESIKSFREAWKRKATLPSSLVEQLDREGCRTFQVYRSKNPNVCGHNDSVSWEGNQPNPQAARPNPASANPVPKR
jgi:tetratricopeptide (TPR) repeat protein